MTEKKQPANITITVRTHDHMEHRISLDTLLDIMKISKDDTDCVILKISQDGNDLAASAPVHEAEYPGVALDAHDAHGRTIYLANAELPNDDYPGTSVARLYAGYAEIETDAPIAAVFTPMRGTVLPEYRPAPTKLVYVDTELAQYRPWDHRAHPEHLEEEKRA